ncbi:glycosyltransferase [Pantoea sp. GM01]|uniref:glycosyltransferase family 2 protein n=1 Tax=Pantoea sp. GM01 TaxID=1144320 RepID=UPI0002714361|nr:glycosyltransferase [Pantoea sp. GM01]EJL89605.1 glycosyl transferase [Pantoea sp. GM01]
MTENKITSSNILVSVVTATFNSERFIIDTYNSILNQTVTNWEWIVTDDCSSDSTMEILKDIQSKDKRVKVFTNEKNYGAAVSRNKCLANCKGEYIAFVDSDDIWYEKKLEKQLKFMNSNIDFSFTAFEIISEDAQSKQCLIDIKEIPPLCYRDMLKKRATLGCSTVILRSRSFPNLQMPLLRTGQDYATWLLILKSGNKAHLLTEALTKYRIVNNSISRNKFKKALRQWQIYREVEGLSLSNSLYYFCHYAYKALSR